MNKTLAALGAFVALSAAALPALADPPAPRQSSRDYEYTFPDDSLLTDTMGAKGATITIRTKPQRTVLIRPRVQFVQEMLKSVENL